MEAPATPGLGAGRSGDPDAARARSAQPYWSALDSGPDESERSAAFPSPFDELGPSPLARRAAEVLIDELESGRALPGDLAGGLHADGGGKMFGVLVVEDARGRLGFLRGFSGTLAGRFDVGAFVPPIFDVAARERIEKSGEPVVKRLTERARAFEASSVLRDARQAARSLRETQAEQSRRLRDEHAERRRQRRAVRARLARVELAAPIGSADAGPGGAVAEGSNDGAQGIVEQRHALDQQSRRDKAEKRELDARQAGQREAVERHLRRVERRLRAHGRLHGMVSRNLMRQIHDTYRIRSARGQVRGLRELFAPAEPPGGAGDCAAPKLLAFALAHDLRPLALAEFWWGAPPATGGRVSGAFYPACREKCRPLLDFMLDGLDVAEPRRFTAPDLRSTGLRILYEDQWIVVVDKPCGLLSVPSRNGAPFDSVLERLARRRPHVSLVHRLDLDTSGVLLAALDARTYAALQRQFLKRTVEKRYLGVVDGSPARLEGEIDLAVRVDVHDRPRQIHDPEHGRRAITRYEVLGPWGHDDGPRRTRVAFVPVTGRTHQIRVHAAHPLGLGTPIVGDRLYGRENIRMLLHSEVLGFVHPATGQALRFESPAPF